jgi:drug/metabolite transporter superfamily protein YnfA
MSDSCGAQVIHMENREVVANESWVYVWVRDETNAIVYVGATGVAPALRSWLHLNHEEPAVGRIAAKYPEVGGDLSEHFTVIAFLVDQTIDRQDVKRYLEGALSESSALDDHYIVAPPSGESFSADVERLGTTIASELLERIHRRIPG